jgi:hypothetical protein
MNYEFSDGLRGATKTKVKIYSSYAEKRNLSDRPKRLVPDRADG